MDLTDLGGDWQKFADVWRSKQLQYTWIRSLSGQYTDFWKVTGDALDFALDALNLHSNSLREKLMHLYLEVHPYPECKQMLGQLHNTGQRLAILSNGTHEMLHYAVSTAGFDNYFDAILTADDAKVFKPDFSVYRLAVERLGISAQDICFISSNGWDAWSAKAFGFHVVWCNRNNQPPERLPFAPDTTISTLSELAW
jgi:2-haloacid dehalogenase